MIERVGFGKSLCYQAMDHMLGLSRISESSSVLVVFPLVALIVDQVKALRSLEPTF